MIVMVMVMVKVHRFAIHPPMAPASRRDTPATAGPC
jgi:hypothetical protein